MAQFVSRNMVVTINLCIILQYSSYLSFAARVVSSHVAKTKHVSTEPLTNWKEETEIISRFCSKTENSALCNSYGKYGSQVLMADVEARKQSLRLAMSIANVAKETADTILNGQKIRSEYVSAINTCQASYNQMFSAFESAWASSSDLKNVISHLKAASQSLDNCDGALAASRNDPSIVNLMVINKLLDKFVLLSDVYSPIDKKN